MTKVLIWLAVAGALIWGADVTTADSIGFNGLKHGEIVNSQFKASMGVTISAENVGGGPNLAIGFDSTETNTADPDLEQPWDDGNLENSTDEFGILLIIAENNIDNNNNGLIDDPDDEGSRPAGRLIFEFDDAIDSFGFDLIDIEKQTESTGGYFASFFDDTTELAKVFFSDFETSGHDFYDATVNFAGDNSANRINPLTAAKLSGLQGVADFTEFNKVVIFLKGSGAVDNIQFTHPGSGPQGVVPLPNAAWMGFALLGALGTMQFLRRRRSRMAA